MVIIFWLFLLFSPILWLVSLILLLVKRRPLTFLFNAVSCGVIIYLIWTGLNSGSQVAAENGSMMDDIGNTASGILEGLTKGFASMVVAAGWGMSILIYSLLCARAEKPELAMLSDRVNSRPATPPPANAIDNLRPGSSKRSNLIAYFIVGAIVLYLLAKKATEMGL